MNAANITIAAGGISQADDIYNTNNFTQGVQANRPAPITANSKEWADFTLANTDHLLSPASFQTEYRSPFSVAFRVKPDDGQPAANGNIMGVTDAAVNNNFSIIHRTDGKIRVIYKSNGNQARADTNIAVFANGAQAGYKNIIVTVDTSNIKIYVNGSEVALDPVNNGDMSGVTMANYTQADGPPIGAQKKTGTGIQAPFDGMIGDVVFVSDVVSSGEISNLNTYLGSA